MTPRGGSKAASGLNASQGNRKGMQVDKKEVQARVRAKLEVGDFFFPEDLARHIARELGVDTEGTFIAQVPAAESSTRGGVPPFSGVPASEEHGTKNANKRVERFNELLEEKRLNKQDGSERITADDVGHEDKLETEVKQEGPIYPDNDSTDVMATAKKGK